MARSEQPLSSNEMPCYGGPGPLFLLQSPGTAASLDIGSGNRSGTRSGARQTRSAPGQLPHFMRTKAVRFTL